RRRGRSGQPARQNPIGSQTKPAGQGNSPGLHGSGGPQSGSVPGGQVGSQNMSGPHAGGATQALPRQIRPGGQTLPHAPQFVGSLPSEVQAGLPAQCWLPGEHGQSGSVPKTSQPDRQEPSGIGLKQAWQSGSIGPHIGLHTPSGNGAQ